MNKNILIAAFSVIAVCNHQHVYSAHPGGLAGMAAEMYKRLCDQSGAGLHASIDSQLESLESKQAQLRGEYNLESDPLIKVKLATLLAKGEANKAGLYALKGRVYAIESEAAEAFGSGARPVIDPYAPTIPGIPSRPSSPVAGGGAGSGAGAAKGACEGE